MPQSTPKAIAYGCCFNYLKTIENLLQTCRGAVWWITLERFFYLAGTLSPVLENLQGVLIYVGNDKYFQISAHRKKYYLTTETKNKPAVTR